MKRLMRSHARKKARVSLLVAVCEYAVSSVALLPLLEHAPLSFAFSAFWLTVHLLSYLTLFLALYAQIRALSFDYTHVDLRLLWGSQLSAEEKRCRVLPILVLCAMLDVFAACVIFT